MLAKRHADPVAGKLDRNRKPLVQPLSQRKVLPTRHIDRADRAITRVHRAGTGDADAIDVVTFERFGRSFEDGGVGTVQIMKRSRPRRVAEHLTVVVDDPRGDLRPTDINRQRNRTHSRTH